MNTKTKPIRDPKTGRMLGSEKNTTPEELLKHFEAYVKFVKKNPKIKEVPNTKTDSIIRLRMEIPATKTGFMVYLQKNKITGNSREILYNRDGRYPDFEEVNAYIDAVCYDDCLNGAMAGVFNHNIVARKLGLTDKQEIKTEGEIKIDFNDAD
tara:strand:+ start:33 stop:491 length:459 start_codon:yes stop_codon:yes gene_type:complete